MVRGELPLDWGCAETLAYASLLEDGFAVRLTGQDSGRGTFFHRHAVLHDQTHRRHLDPAAAHRDAAAARAGDRFGAVGRGGARLRVRLLDHRARQSLVVWEAQYGDFANGAQVIIDQFISSGEAKWERFCGLTLFLPHGYEGAGPEHSSARLERFLQLCAENNMQVCVPSTPAQMFHMLRRQMRAAVSQAADRHDARRACCDTSCRCRRSRS